MWPRPPGVSRSAVSFAFNNPQRISAATRERILAVAAELGYAPNTLARMLQAGTTNSIGVLLPQRLAQILENPYYARFLMGVGQVCDQEGYTLLLTPAAAGLGAQGHPVRGGGRLHRLRAGDRPGAEVAELERRGIPFVLIDSDRYEGAPQRRGRRPGWRPRGHPLPAGAGAPAARRAVHRTRGRTWPTRGYRGPLARRMAGIADALAGGRAVAWPTSGLAEVPVTRAEGYRATKELMAAAEPPTAILALSDVLAYGAVDALQELGLDVPGDVSVTGFDDLAESAWFRPRLTTVRQPIVTKGRSAADFLISADQGRGPAPPSDCSAPR